MHVKAADDDWVYVEVQQGIYGLPQAWLSAQGQLEKHLAHNGHQQNKHTPGLWMHNTQKI